MSQLPPLAARLRARDACEYCLFPADGQFQVDHIIPVARWNLYAANRLRAVERIPGRRGPNHLDNFAWSCPFCNSAKGQQAARRAGRRTSRLFDPRRDRWSDHFVFMRGYLFIADASAIGRATAEALRFYDSRLDGPLGPRHEAIIQGRYPPAWARPHSVG